MRLYLIAFLCVACFIGATAQNIPATTSNNPKKIETHFRVDGLCGMCKNRIEGAIDVKGVVYSEWNRETRDLFVVYKSNKIQEEQLHQLINQAGHDTEKSNASDEAYSAIHGCCKYREDESHP